MEYIRIYKVQSNYVGFEKKKLDLAHTLTYKGVAHNSGL
jgi:hypothetical protein